MDNCEGRDAMTRDETPPREGRSALGALCNRQFALYWGGLLVSATGSWMQVAAQGWLVFELTGSKYYLGIVAAAGMAPLLLLSLPGGVVADRLNKRRITIVTQSLALVQALTIGTLTYTGLIQPWHIVALASFSGIINSFDVPARQAMTFEIVGRDDLVNAVSLNSFAFNFARFVGPSAAGIIIARAGTSACFFFNAASFLAVITSLLIIRPRPLAAIARDVPMVHQVWEGLLYASKHVIIRDVLVLTGIASIFALQYSSQLPALAKVVLNVGPERYGWLMAATGLGAGAAALTVALTGHMFRAGRIVSIGAMIAPIGMMALSTTRSYVVALGYLFVIGFGMMMFLAISNSMVQMASPDELRGRMLSVRTLAFMGLGVIGAWLTGLLAQRFGVQRALLIGGLVTACASICFALFSRAAKDIPAPTEGVVSDVN